MRGIDDAGDQAPRILSLLRGKPIKLLARNVLRRR
jgi:hypothetical protein